MKFNPWFYIDGYHFHISLPQCHHKTLDKPYSAPFNDKCNPLLQIHDMSTNTKKILWTRTGNQQRDWSDACVALSEFAGDTVEASFIAVKGSGPLGDIALDNVEFTTSCPSRFLHVP